MWLKTQDGSWRNTDYMRKIWREHDKIFFYDENKFGVQIGAYETPELAEETLRGIFRAMQENRKTHRMYKGGRYVD